MTQNLARFEGRLFAEGGCLFLVVHVNEAAEVARVSCRVDGQTQLIEMPLSEVARRVASGAALILDNLNSPESARRVLRHKDGWYFSAREGEIGPFESETQAGQELVKHILCMQTAGTAARQPLPTARAVLRNQGERRRPVENRQAV